MSDALVPFSFGGPSGLAAPIKLQRRIAAEVSRAQAAGLVLAARETAKVEAVADVTQAALLEVSQLSALEGLLVSRVPHAEARLRYIADAGVAGIADVVIRTGRNIR